MCAHNVPHFYAGKFLEYSLAICRGEGWRQKCLPLYYGSASTHDLNLVPARLALCFILAGYQSCVSTYLVCVLTEEIMGWYHISRFGIGLSVKHNVHRVNIIWQQLNNPQIFLEYLQSLWFTFNFSASSQEIIRRHKYDRINNKRS